MNATTQWAVVARSRAHTRALVHTSRVRRTCVVGLLAFQEKSRIVLIDWRNKDTWIAEQRTRWRQCNDNDFWLDWLLMKEGLSKKVARIKENKTHILHFTFFNHNISIKVDWNVFIYWSSKCLFFKSSHTKLQKADSEWTWTSTYSRFTQVFIPPQKNLYWFAENSMFTSLQQEHSF